MEIIFYTIAIILVGYFGYNEFNKRRKPKHHQLNTSRMLSRKELLNQANRNHKLKRSPIAIYSISIDRFEGIKQKFSADVARQVTTEVGKRIRAHVRDNGQLAQIQLHEYCLILTDLDTNHAQTVGANLCQIINDKKLQLPQHLISVSISIGCVYSARNHADLNELLTESIMLMQAASEQGRNNFEYSDMSDVAAVL